MLSSPNSNTIFLETSHSCFYNKLFLGSLWNPRMSYDGMRIVFVLTSVNIIKGYIILSLYKVWCKMHLKLTNSKTVGGNSRCEGKKKKKRSCRKGLHNSTLLLLTFLVFWNLLYTLADHSSLGVKQKSVLYLCLMRDHSFLSLQDLSVQGNDSLPRSW